MKVTPHERKILLAAGAAAGMTATFGSPIAAVLLAIELLLFELSPAAIMPVAVASAAAHALGVTILGGEPVFPMHATWRLELRPSWCFEAAFPGSRSGAFTVVRDSA